MPAGGAFRDPSAQVFGLLGRLHTIDNARRVVALHDNLHRMLQERSQSESSGVNRLDVELVDASKVPRSAEPCCRDQAIPRWARWRLKFMLGLSPHAALLLDRQSLAPFRAVRESIENWTKIPKRDPQTLHKLVARRPALGEVVLDRQPLFAQVATNPDQWEEILNHATELAVKNRKERDKASAFANTGVQLELQVRRRIRSLFDALRAYEGEKELYELVIARGTRFSSG